MENNENPYIVTRGFNFFNEEISPEDIDVQLSNPKDTLNSEIWAVEMSGTQDIKLRKNIRIAILKIAKVFKEYLNLNLVNLNKREFNS